MKGELPIEMGKVARLQGEKVARLQGERVRGRERGREVARLQGRAARLQGRAEGSPHFPPFLTTHVVALCVHEQRPALNSLCPDRTDHESA